MKKLKNASELDAIVSQNQKHLALWILSVTEHNSLWRDSGAKSRRQSPFVQFPDDRLYVCDDVDVMLLTIKSKKARYENTPRLFAKEAMRAVPLCLKNGRKMTIYAYKETFERTMREDPILKDLKFMYVLDDDYLEYVVFYS